MTRSSRQSGSAIVLIFIAVAIFGALSFAVMRGGSGSMQTLTDEQARLAANEIIAYGDALAKTVQTLKLRGCSDTQFDFANTSWVLNNETPIHPEGHNTLAPTDGSCSVFKQAGGKLTPAVFSEGLVVAPSAPTPTGTKIGSSRILEMAVPGVGTSLEEVILFVGYGKTEVCMAINNISGVQNLSDTAPRHTRTSINYDGVFGNSRLLTDTDGLLTGKTSFCTIDDTLSDYSNRYYRVLIAR